MSIGLSILSAGVSGQDFYPPIPQQCGYDDDFDIRGNGSWVDNVPMGVVDANDKTWGDELGYTGRGIGDVNGDDRADIALTFYRRDADPATGAAEEDGRIEVWGMVEDGGSPPVLVWQRIGDPIEVAPDGMTDAQVLAHHMYGGDVDGDGNNDLVLLQRGTECDGASGFSGLTVYSFSDEWSGQTSGSHEWVRIAHFYGSCPDQIGMRGDIIGDANGDGVRDLMLSYNRLDVGPSAGERHWGAMIFFMPAKSYWDDAKDCWDPAMDWTSTRSAPLEGDVEDCYSVKLYGYCPNSASGLGPAGYASFIPDMDGDSCSELILGAGFEIVDADDPEKLRYGYDCLNLLTGYPDCSSTNPLVLGRVYLTLSSSMLHPDFDSVDAFLHDALPDSSCSSPSAPDPTGNQLNINIDDTDLVITGHYTSGSWIDGPEGLTIGSRGANFDGDGNGYMDIVLTQANLENTHGEGSNFYMFKIEEYFRYEVANDSPDADFDFPTVQVHLDAFDADYHIEPDVELRNGWYGGDLMGDMGSGGNPAFLMTFGGNSSPAGGLQAWRFEDVGGSATPVQILSILPEETDYEGLAMYNGVDTSDRVAYSSGVCGPNVTDYECHALPHSGTAGDTFGPNGGRSFHKNLTISWWAGDTNGNGRDDILTTARRYPGHLFKFTDGMTVDWNSEYYDQDACDGCFSGAIATTADIDEDLDEDFLIMGKMYVFQSDFSNCDLCTRAGDVDNDGDVDLCDWCAAFDNVAMEVTPCTGGDLDGDGYVSSDEVQFVYLQIGETTDCSETGQDGCTWNQTLMQCE